MIYFVVWLALSFVVGFIGRNKTLGFVGSFFASFFLSPLFGLIFVIVSNGIPKNHVNQSESNAYYR